MKKSSFLGGIVAIVIAGGAVLHVKMNLQDGNLSDVTLTNIEAQASECIVSSASYENTGYCIARNDGSGDSCVSKGTVNDPRCSGQID
jgi:hypothetical protein